MDQELGDQALGPLAAGFDKVSLEAWRGVVEKALKGGTIEDRLTTRTDDGLILKPLYTRADWPQDRAGVVGAAPFTRGAERRQSAEGGWDKRQVVDDPRLDEAARHIAAELAGGVSSLALRFADTARVGEQGEGPWGLRVPTLGALETLLAEVPLDRIGIVLDAGGHGFAAASALLALFERKKADPAKLRGALNVDPLGALARRGGGAGIERALADAAGLSRLVAVRYPDVTSLGVDGRLYHAAGASEAQEVGFALATAVAYLRALDAAGMGIETALGQLVFSFAVDSNFFRSMAKLRAARLAWSRVVGALDLGDKPSAEAGRMTIWAETAWRDLAKRDAHVNMLRATAGCFAAICGGAEAISVRPFDEAIAVPGVFGRRIARNTQLVLAEESGLGRVLDPGGGAWFIESLTEELAAEAWTVFQDVEAKGGMVKALQSGAVAALIATVARAREARIAVRAEPITGVSNFPDLAEPLVSRAAINWAALAAAEKAAEKAANTPGTGTLLARLKDAGPNARAQAAIDALNAGASLAQLTDCLGAFAGGSAAGGLQPTRRAAGFEALRAASDGLPKRPRVFLANWGSARDYLDRANFARNLFAAGGVEAIDDEGFTDMAALLAAARKAKAQLIVLSSSDAQYAETGPRLLAELKSLNPKGLYVVAKPDDNLKAAGIDAFVHRGIDALALLRGALQQLGAQIR